jgi:hypothetical protein
MNQVHAGPAGTGKIHKQVAQTSSAPAAAPALSTVGKGFLPGGENLSGHLFV